MNKQKKYININIFIISGFLFFYFAGNVSAVGLKDEAKGYRDKGYEAQVKGDVDLAIEYYQKACELNPQYSAPHNDLGILYETKGWLDRAESEYKKAVAITPDYKEAHANLALLYERKGELEKASFHWMKRYKLGQPDEEWTKEARSRLKKVGLLDETLDAKPIEQKIEPKEDKTEKGWERIGKTKEEKISKTPHKKLVKAERKCVGSDKTYRKIKANKPKETYKKSKSAKKPENKKRKKASGWARLGGEEKSSGKAKKYRHKTASVVSRSTNMDSELQEALRLAEERLKEEKYKDNQKGSPEKETVVREPKIADSKLNDYYSKAKDYYNKGEYSRALDTIREAKRDMTDDETLSTLENQIKTKMKEERIQDHCNEGMILYRQNDVTGAKKEFESILSILPE